MFHVKLGHPISQTSGKGGTATSRASRRCSSCASESCRSEFLESVAPARNSEGPAFAEPPISEGSFRILASRKGAQSRCAGSRPRDARCQLRPSRIHRAPCRLARVFPPPFDAPPTSLKSIELLRATGISVATGFSRDRLLHLNGKNRTSGTGRNGRRETQLATLPGRRSREGWAERNGGGTERGSGTASKKQVRFPRCHSTRAATFFATPKRLRASSSGNPSTYMTSASPTPVATTPNRYMGRYSPSSAIVVNGMV